MFYAQRSRIIPINELEARFRVKVEHCPFCASCDVGLFMGPAPHMCCCSCGAEGPYDERRRGDYEHSQYEAILKWNHRIPRRADPSPVRTVLPRTIKKQWK